MSTEVKLRNDGLYLYRDTDLLNGVEKVEGDITAEWLCAQVPKPGIKLPTINTHMETKYKSKIKPAVVKQILGTIQQFPHTEVLFYLYYSLIKGDWYVATPPQSGQGASVSAKFKVLEGIPESYYPVGTIHTHPEMGAFWSGTDRNDQEGKDGFHIVFGTKGGHVDTFKATLFTSTGNAYEKGLEDILDLTGVDFKADYKPNAAWMKVLTEIKPPEPAVAAFGSSYSYRGSGWDYGSFRGRETCDFGDFSPLKPGEIAWHNTMETSGCTTPKNPQNELMLKLRELLENFDHHVAMAIQRNSMVTDTGWYDENEELREVVENIVEAKKVDLLQIISVATTMLAEEDGSLAAEEALTSVLEDVKADREADSILNDGDFTTKKGAKKW